MTLFFSIPERLIKCISYFSFTFCGNIICLSVISTCLDMVFKDSSIKLTVSLTMLFVILWWNLKLVNEPNLGLRGIELHCYTQLEASASRSNRQNYISLQNWLSLASCHFQFVTSSPPAPNGCVLASHLPWIYSRLNTGSLTCRPVLRHLWEMRFLKGFPVVEY